MKKIIKRILVVGLLALVGIQFIPADVNHQNGIPPTDIRFTYDVPEKIIETIEISCYDCHSNNTNYPWYSHIQPIRFFLDNHVEEGKEELNFNEFKTYSDRKKRNKLRSITEQIRENEMPLSSYTIIHNDAKLTKERASELTDFFSTLKKK